MDKRIFGSNYVHCKVRLLRYKTADRRRSQRQATQFKTKSGRNFFIVRGTARA